MEVANNVPEDERYIHGRRITVLNFAFEENVGRSHIALSFIEENPSFRRLRSLLASLLKM